MLGDLHVQTSGGVRAGGPGHRPWRTGGRCYPGPYLGRAKSPAPSGCVPVPREAHICRKTEGPERLGWLGLPPASCSPSPCQGTLWGRPHPGPGQHTLGRQGYLLPAPPRTPEGGGAGLWQGGALVGRGLERAGLWRGGALAGRGFGGRGSRGYLTWAAWPPCPLTAPPSGRSSGRPPRLGDSLLGSGLGQSGGPCEPLWVTEVREPGRWGPRGSLTFPEG